MSGWSRAKNKRNRNRIRGNLENNLRLKVTNLLRFAQPEQLAAATAGTGVKGQQSEYIRFFHVQTCTPLLFSDNYRRLPSVTFWNVRHNNFPVML